MPITTNSAAESVKKLKLKNLAKSLAVEGGGPSVCEAAQNLLVAIDYSDPVLAESSLASLRSALRDVVQGCIDRAIGAPTGKLKKSIEDLLEVFSEDGCYDDDDVDFINDALKQAVQYIDHSLRQLADTQRLALSIQKMGYSLQNLPELQFEIDAIKTMSERILSAQLEPISETPPLDKEMVARSKAADKRGEVKSIDDLLNCL